MEQDLTKPELIAGFLYLSPRSLFKGYNQFAALLVGFLGIIFLLWISFYLISYVTGISRSFDTVMREAGLDSERYMIFGRIYKGKIDGKNIEVNFIPSTGLRPALLNIIISPVDIGTKLAIVHDNPLLDCADCKLITGFENELDGIKVYAQDEKKANEYLEDSQIKHIIISLMDDQSEHSLREIYFRPSSVLFRIHPRKLNVEIFKSWLYGVIELTTKLEKYGQGN